MGEIRGARSQEASERWLGGGGLAQGRAPLFWEGGGCSP